MILFVAPYRRDDQGCLKGKAVHILDNIIMIKGLKGLWEEFLKSSWGSPGYITI